MFFFSEIYELIWEPQFNNTTTADYLLQSYEKSVYVIDQNQMTLAIQLSNATTGEPITDY